MYTLSDIREELRKPGRDPRDKFVAPKLREDVKEIADLQAGHGAGRRGHQRDASSARSWMSACIRTGWCTSANWRTASSRMPSEVVKVGQIVKVQVLNADPKAKRIALSMKALMGPPPQHRPKQQQAKPQPSLDDKLSSLSSKWKVR